ncbi:MAG: FtsK/SpoIIIE domain-containing protein, partial [Actinomycetota bacterium]
MELLLRVTPTGGQPRDVVVVADPDARIGALSGSLAGFLGSPPGARSLFREASAERLDPNATLEQARLVSGDALALGARPDRPQKPHPELQTNELRLTVLAGPEAGRTYLLTPGQFLAGRGPQATIPIDDPTVSRRAFGLHVSPDGGAVIVPEANGPNGPKDLLVDGLPLDRPRQLGDESLIQAGATVLAARRSMPQAQEATDRLGCLPYHRTPYRPSIVAVRSFPILEDIPSRPEPRRLPVLGSLAPVVGGVALYAFTRQAEFLALLALTPITMGASWVEERRAGGRKYAREAADFHLRLQARKAEADAAVQAERLERLRAAPDAAELARRAELRAEGLWPRGRGDADFLRVRLGLGDIASSVRCPVGTQGDADLRAEAASALAGHDLLASAPIVVALGDLGTLAICGSAEAVTAAAAALVVQAATLHSPEDLVIFAALKRDRLLADHVSWLPHTRSLNSPLATRHVVTAAEAGQALCSRLAAVAERRLEARDDGTDRRWPRLLVILDEALDLDPAVLAHLLDLAQPAGITAIWLGSSEARVPRQAQAVLRCVPSDRSPSGLWFRDPAKELASLEVETLPPDAVDRAVRSLSPLRDASSTNVASAIPRVVPLFAALGLEEPAGPDRQQPPLSRAIVERWLADAGDSLEAPLGLTAGGVMSLDLVADGPHALIGGTSGSGKSELLVALVAGLLAQHPPSRLNLLFVDYKGGAASSVYKTAPHTVGYVTNLNGDLATRALVSLWAELDRR